MKKRIILLTALLAGIFALPAFAEQLVGRVQVDISPNEDLELEAGATYSKPDARAMDSGYEVSNFSVDGKYNTRDNSLILLPWWRYAARMKWR